MKHLTTFTATLLLVLAFASSFAQTIRRVNNNPGVTGVNVYATAQAAHDAANANDILMIEPSSTSYGDLTLTKPLKVYGNGYFLSTNTELKADQRSSLMGTVIFATGSSGSSFNGIQLNGYFGNQVGSTAYNITNITIERCYASSLGFTTPYSSGNGQGTASLSNFTIKSSHINTVSFNPIAPATISNVLVSNNIIKNGLNNGGSGADYFFNGTVLNNTFNCISGSVITLTLSNSVFENNLITPPIPGYSNGYNLAFTNVTISYNVSYTNHFTTINGNQNNFDVASALVGTGTGISDDENYQIKTGSALKTAGSGGTEVGAYGGSTPYVVSGIPPIPSIVNMTNTATGSNSTPLSVTVSVKSNN